MGRTRWITEVSKQNENEAKKYNKWNVINVEIW